MNPPERIKVEQTNRCLTLQYPEQTLKLPFELLRVYSPSAEVKGHGGQGGSLPTGKRHIGIENIEPVGNYAIRIFFDDGHNSGLYSWQYLAEMASEQDALWQAYEDKLVAQGGSREPLFIQAKNL